MAEDGIGKAFEWFVAVWPVRVQFVASVCAVIAVTWWILNWTYSARLSSKEGEISLLTRQRDDAREKLGGSPAQESSRVGAAVVRAGTAQLYIGGDPWSDPFAPVVHAKLALWAEPRPTRIHNLFARIKSDTIDQSFKSWRAIDWSSNHPVAERKSTMDISSTIVDRGHYFTIQDDDWKKFKFRPGRYTLSLTAFDDEGQEVPLVKSMQFALSEKHVAHIAARQGIYFNWDVTEKAYKPLMSGHE